MRTIPPALQTRLDSGVTTLCRCWVINRADGVTQGFTDHDDDITLDAVSCHAGGGLTGSEVTQKLGFAVDFSELSGALAGDSLNEADLAAGRYDAATSRSGWSIGASRRCVCCLQTARSARSGAKARPSPRNCAGWAIGSRRRAAGSIPQTAPPISATAAAGRSRRSRLSVAPAASFRPRRHRPSRRADSTASTTAGSPPAD